MKLKFQKDRKFAVNGRDAALRRPDSAARCPYPGPHSVRGFTMVEIALSLAIIGFALVAIIGILPLGLSVQKDNREQTVVNLDAAFLMDTIRSGAQGQADLENYIFAITNVFTLYNADGSRAGGPPTTNWFTPTASFFNGTVSATSLLTNSASLVGLLSIPKYISTNGGAQFYSNTITADFRAINGPAMDQGFSATSADFAFRYRVTIEITPASEYAFAGNNGNWLNLAAPQLITGNTDDPSQAVSSKVAQNLQANLYDIRLSFHWPILPATGQPGGGRQVYRSSASGILQSSSPPIPNPPHIYHFNPQNYTAE